ncbi:uncharacterized protein LOC144307364 isoform X3 [Canis aureus]
MILITQPDKQARPAKVLSGLKEIEFWRLKRDILLITDSLGAVQNSILLSRCANLLIHAPTEGHLDYLHILAIMNKPSITMCVQNFVETLVTCGPYFFMILGSGRELQLPITHAITKT